MLEDSSSIHQCFLELLKAGNGVLGLFDVELDEYLLLENSGCGVFVDAIPFDGFFIPPDVDWFVSIILEAKRQSNPIWQRQGNPVSFRQKWITPFPHSVMFSRPVVDWFDFELEQFWTAIHALTPEANDEVIELLLDDLNKRYNVVGSYFAAFRHRDQFAERISRAMIRYPYEAHSYCFALAYLGTQQAAEALETYLNHYLPINEHNPVWDELSIDWAIAALQYIDEQLGTHRAKNYMTDDGVWDRWAGWKIKPARQDLDKLLELARKHFG